MGFALGLAEGRRSLTPVLEGNPAPERTGFPWYTAAGRSGQVPPPIGAGRDCGRSEVNVAGPLVVLCRSGQGLTGTL